MKLEFVSTDFLEMLSYQVLWKSVLGGGMRTDRHMTKLMVAFLNFANAPLNEKL